MSEDEWWLPSDSSYTSDDETSDLDEEAGDVDRDINGGNVDVNGGNVDVNGGNVDVNGGNVDVNGGNVDVNGENVDVNGENVDVNGENVDVNGENVDVNGENVDVNGENVDVNGENVDVNGENVDLDRDVDVMTRALMNTVVLDAIFACFDLPDLKSTRQVCKEWNKAGVHALAIRGVITVVNLKKMWTCCDLSDAVPPEYDTNLAKRVIVMGECSCPGSLGLVDHALSENFPKFVAPIQQVVEEMVLTVDVNFFSNLPRFLDNFINLNCLSVTIDLNSRRQEVLDCTNPSVQLPSLKSFILKYTLYNVALLRRIAPIQQLILNSAPKLEFVTMPPGLNTSLENCPNIKIFEFVALKEGTINIPFEILEPIKTSLQELLLSSQLKIASGIVNLPLMPNLTTLHAPFSNVLPSFLQRDIFPNLKHLGLLLDGSWRTRNMTLGDQYPNIESLHLKGLNFLKISDKGDISRILASFPSVKKLNLELEMVKNVKLYERKILLRDVLKIFEGWKDLVRAHVEVTYAENMNVVEAVLSGIRAWRGQKSVVFHRFDVNTGSPTKINMPKPFLFLPPKQQFSRVEFHGFGKSNLVQPKNEERETILEEAIRAFAVKNELPGF